MSISPLPQPLIFCAMIFFGVTACSSQTTSPTQPPPTPTVFYEDASATNLPLADLTGLSMDAESADLDADGDLDIVVAHEFRPNILLLNDGSGVFTNGSSRVPTTNRDSEDIGIADFDGDGDLDIIIVSEDDQTNELYLNDGNANFTDASNRIPVTGVTNGVAVFDFNNDGLPDVALGNNGQNRIIINIGDATFIDETDERLPLRNDITQDLEVADVDGDGDGDLLIGNEDANRLLINDGSGVFTDETTQRLPLRETLEITREADLGDLDGDGDLDILFANVTNLVSGGDAQNRILLNDGSGMFEDVTAAQFPVSNERSFEGDILDIDGDGDLDIMTGNLPASGSAAPRYNVYVNDGNANFSNGTNQTLPAGINGFGFDINQADFSGDGDPDLYLASRGSADHLLLFKRP